MAMAIYLVSTTQWQFHTTFIKKRKFSGIPNHGRKLEKAQW